MKVERTEFRDVAKDWLAVETDDGSPTALLKTTSPGGGPGGENVSLSFHLSERDAFEMMGQLYRWLGARAALGGASPRRPRRSRKKKSRRGARSEGSAPTAEARDVGAAEASAGEAKPEAPAAVSGEAKPKGGRKRAS
jgi:hypothetical protein